MRDSKRYTIQRAANEGGRSILESEGRTPIEVDGREIEAEYELNDGSTLVWLSDGSPYEEGLHVYLIDKTENVIDAIEAGAAWAAAIFKVQELHESAIDFEFFSNDETYRLEVHEEAELRIKLPTGWKYKSVFKRHRLGVRMLTSNG